MMFQRILIFLGLPIFAISFEPRVVTPAPVLGYKEVTYKDADQAERQLLVWYPVSPLLSGSASNDPWDLFQVAINAPIAESNAKLPVIVLSHGYMGNPHHLSWLIRGLVYEGFIVIAVQHRDFVDGQLHVNHWKRARDIHEMLDRFKELDLAANSDLNKVGMAGFSLGGTTGILIGGGRITHLDSLVPSSKPVSREEFLLANQALTTLNKEMMTKDWRDTRVKALFLMAPAWSWLFDENSLTSMSTPIYLIAAESDQVLVTANNAGLFARSIPNSIYRTISGKVGHFIFISASSTKQQNGGDAVRLRFLVEDDASVDRTWIQSQVTAEASRFFKSVLNNALPLSH